jgi:2-succinyl-5-enolpyruvyl-6-hydroxy-3-cyclohexene-1-carboxylate synthase
MSNLLSENINRLWSSLIISDLIKNNITQFYISPGMRNAPLIAALCFYKKLHPQIEIITCIDERGASYRALGYSKASGSPCVLLCTSGTALANYLPAIIESFKSHLPLIIISADRPKEQVMSGENQTINQTGIFSHFLRGELSLDTPSFEISPNDLSTNISNLISKAMAHEKGPVHINCPFREPLENTIQAMPENYLKAAQLIADRSSVATEYLKTSLRLEQKELEYFYQILSKSNSGILVIGSLPSSANQEFLREFIKALHWPVYLDVSSSLKYEYSLSENAIPTFDHPEVMREFVANPPHTILHIGGRLTSKHYYTLLQQLPSTTLITINNSSDKEDPGHQAKIRINADVNALVSELTKVLNNNLNNISVDFSLNFKTFIERKIKTIEDSPLSYPVISKMVIESLPKHSFLYIANSTVVRSFDSYCSLTSKQQYTIATNRGVSGIEGFIASSCGVIDASKKEAYLIIGDISFMHDLNSLYFLSQMTCPLKIILINNFGGGIFTLLPINQEEEVLSLITTPHHENFEKTASNFNLHYIAVKEVSKLASALEQLTTQKAHTLLEIFVDHQLNKNVYHELRTIKLS